MARRRAKVDPVKILADGARRLLSGDVDGARAACDRVLAKSPERTDALELRCLVALEEGDHAKALEVVDRALAVEETAKRHVARAKAAIGLERWDDAEAALARALRLDPADPTTYEVEAALHAAHEDYERALHAAEGARAIAPERVKARALEAAALRALGRDDDALEAYRAAVRASEGGASARLSVLREMIGFLEERGEEEEAKMAGALIAQLEGIAG